MFDFRSADAKGQSSQRTVRRRVTVAADHDHAGSYEPLLVHQDMFDALSCIVGTIKRINAEIAAVFGEIGGLKRARLIMNHTRIGIGRRNDVVDHAQVRVGSKNAAAALAHTAEGLRTRVFVGKVSVHVKKHRFPVNTLDRVALHNLLV